MTGEAVWDAAAALLWTAQCSVASLHAAPTVKSHPQHYPQCGERARPQQHHVLETLCSGSYRTAGSAFQ